MNDERRISVDLCSRDGGHTEVAKIVGPGLGVGDFFIVAASLIGGAIDIMERHNLCVMHAREMALLKEDAFALFIKGQNINRLVLTREERPTDDREDALRQN